MFRELTPTCLYMYNLTNVIRESTLLNPYTTGHIPIKSVHTIATKIKIVVQALAKSVNTKGTT